MSAKEAFCEACDNVIALSMPASHDSLSARASLVIAGSRLVTGRITVAMTLCLDVSSCGTGRKLGPRQPIPIARDGLYVL